MTSFKKGDRVTINTAKNTYLRKLDGATATVTSPYSSECKVELDKPELYLPRGSSVKHVWVCVDQMTLMPADTIVADVTAYLSRTDGSTSDRQRALSSLATHGFFHAEPKRAREILELYLKTNPDRFCDAGVKRFRAALSLAAPLPERNPANAKALNLADLKYGTEFVWTDAVGTNHGRYVYLGEISDVEICGSRKIKVVKVREGSAWRDLNEATWLWTGDAGLAPYNNGKPNARWNESYFCVAPADIPKPPAPKPVQTVATSTRRTRSAISAYDTRYDAYGYKRRTYRDYSGKLRYSDTGARVF